LILLQEADSPASRQKYSENPATSPISNEDFLPTLRSAFGNRSCIWTGISIVQWRPSQHQIWSHPNTSLADREFRKSVRLRNDRVTWKLMPGTGWLH